MLAKRTRYIGQERFTRVGPPRYRSRKKAPRPYKKVRNADPPFDNSYVNSFGKFPGLGFPNKLMFKHKYVKDQIISISAGSPTSKTFLCNGLFQPETAAGHQPMYFDQLTALYDHYTVVGAVMKCTFSTITTGSGGSPPVICAVNVNDDTTMTPTTMQNVLELTPSVGRVVLGAQNSQAVIVSKWSAKGTFGGSILANDNLQGTSAANPTEVSCWHVVCAVAGGGSDSLSISVLVEIEYIAVWDELKDIASS